MRHEVTLTEKAHSIACNHLLSHFNQNKHQEELCFALWYPCNGKSKTTALISEIILPEEGERGLHGNASFSPQFLARSLRIAKKKKAGLAFMHSHPTQGWQDMSGPDIIAEQDRIASPANSTNMPLVGLTVGTDESWSARFWIKKKNREFKRFWCDKVKVVGNCLKITFNERAYNALQNKNILRRTIETWGSDEQLKISRMTVGIVGVGSVGSMVGENLARIGVGNVVLIDYDKVEEHNLDRLLYATKKDVGKFKSEFFKTKILKHSVNENVKVKSIIQPIQSQSAFRSVLDCDIIFSCVDRPLARDVLNHIAYAYLIPVIDGGIAVNKRHDKFSDARWSSHIITYGHKCMLCRKQYTTSDVSMELDGSLEDPSYIEHLHSKRGFGNENVFPFSQNLSSIEVLMMIHFLLSKDWWPKLNRLEYNFLSGQINKDESPCNKECYFLSIVGKGDVNRIKVLQKDIKIEKRNLLDIIFKLWR